MESMPSPFPGMDPYLEGHLWPDVHNALAAKIRQILAPLLRPRYAVRLALYVVEDPTPEVDLGILYPDVEVLSAPAQPERLSGSGSVLAAVPAPLTVPLLLPVDVQTVAVEVRDAATNRLVTSIELLSPVNKREPGPSAYRGKRRRLHRAGVHLLELDLLRRGTRPSAHPRVPASAYLLTLVRARGQAMEAWPLRIEDPLPVLPVPLEPPDEDVALDLPLALRAIYVEAAYELSIDYGGPPPPPALSEAEAQWVLGLPGRS
jgi:hypothetical protein